MSLFFELPSGKWSLKPTKSGPATRETWKTLLRTFVSVRYFLRTIYGDPVVPQETS